MKYINSVSDVRDYIHDLMGDNLTYELPFVLNIEWYPGNGTVKESVQVKYVKKNSSKSRPRLFEGSASQPIELSYCVESMLRSEFSRVQEWFAAKEREARIEEEVTKLAPFIGRHILDELRAEEFSAEIVNSKDMSIVVELTDTTIESLKNSSVEHLVNLRREVERADYLLNLAKKFKAADVKSLTAKEKSMYYEYLQNKIGWKNDLVLANAYNELKSMYSMAVDFEMELPVSEGTIREESAKFVSEALLVEGITTMYFIGNCSGVFEQIHDFINLGWAVTGATKLEDKRWCREHHYKSLVLEYVKKD